MVSFVVVRVTYDAALITLLEQLENLDLPYSICSDPHNLKVPSEQSVNGLLGSLDYTVPVPHATGTAEVSVSGEEIDVLSLLNDGSEQKAIDGSEQKTSDEMKPSQECLFEKVGTSKGSDVGLQNPPQPPEIWRRATTLQFPIPGHHVIGNIKRYRRQKCKLCNKFFSVPFLQTKMIHASVHSDFRRFKCMHCGKRAITAGSVKAHIKTRHRGEDRNDYIDEMTEEEHKNLLALTEKCFDDAYM